MRERVYSSGPTDCHRATMTCPLCGHSETETVTKLPCLHFYDCRGCVSVLKPKGVDSRVFCSHSDKQCPPRQRGWCCPKPSTLGL
jgi:hypothetical protein